MADEALILESSLDTLNIRQVTVADGSGINKGSLIVLGSDPNTGVIHSNSQDTPLGILAEEKVASDGETAVGVHTRGDWDMVTEGAILLGALVVPGIAANQVRGIVGSLSGEDLNKIMGICLETASAGEQVRIRLKLG